MWSWRKRSDEDFAEEIRANIALETDRLIAAGMSPEEARSAAVRAFGNVTRAQERFYESGRMICLDDLRRDIGYACRMLVKNPGFAAVVVLTLALGIGANSTMFTVLDTYLFRPLPYPEGDRLVRVWRTAPQSQSWPHSVATFLDLRDRNDVFQYMVALNGITPALISEGQAAEALQGVSVTADFFPALGVEPALGRVFTLDEDQPSSSSVVVLSDRFWRRRFGADPAIIGRYVRLDSDNVQVIGVMPPRFEHPLLWGPIDVYRPLAFTPEQRANRLNNYLAAFARLKVGVSMAKAQAATATLFDSISNATGSQYGNSVRLEPLQRSIAQNTERTVWWFAFGLAGLVLLIACVNLANLQLVRTVARSQEHSIRAALGADRARLLRQSLTESVVIAGLGGGLSVAVALGGIAFINQRLFAELPGADVGLDFRVLAFTLCCSLMAALVFGTMPAFLASRADLNGALKRQARGASPGGHLTLRHALIVGQVAFALVLLTGAGLFLRGLSRFTRADVGWQVDGLLTAQLDLRGTQYTTPVQRLGFYRQLEERLRVIPGVDQAALSTSPAAWSFYSSGAMFVEGQPEPARDQYPEAFFEPVTDGYFQTLGIRLLAGRTFGPGDTSDRPPVVIINETMANRFWPNESPVGKRIARVLNRTWMEVVGVVNDVRFPGSVPEPYTRLQVFRPLAQSPPPVVNISLRTRTAPDALVEEVRRAVAELDASQAVQRIRPARALVEQGLGNLTLLGTLLGAFAALGLVLACIGIYGVTSYAVAQRTAEFGIRLALGASTRHVLSLAVVRGIGLIVLGVMVGLAGAYGVSRFLIATIPSLPTKDPGALIGIGLALTIVGSIACYLPARRATKVDPLVALRCE
jgi:putative ABC transport system permease protein